MRERRGPTVWLIAGFAAVVAFSSASCGRAPAGEDAAPRLVSAYPPRLPDGPGRDIAERSCLACHSATLITQQAKDSTAWAKTLGTMEKWSAPVPPPQRDTLLVYLVARLGARP